MPFISYVVSKIRSLDIQANTDSVQYEVRYGLPQNPFPIKDQLHLRILLVVYTPKNEQLDSENTPLEKEKTKHQFFEFHATCRIISGLGSVVKNVGTPSIHDIHALFMA